MCASSTKPDVKGANISVIRRRYLSQYPAEVCHAEALRFGSQESLWFDGVARCLAPRGRATILRPNEAKRCFRTGRHGAAIPSTLYCGCGTIRRYGLGAFQPCG